MALPGVKTTAKQGLGILGHASIAGFSYLDYKSRVEQGQNPVVAGALAVGANVITAGMGIIPGMIVLDAFTGFSGTRALGSGLYNQYRGMQTFMRTSRTPFSHKFEHTDATFGAQQRGMQAIGMGSNFVGSEAGLMAQRYGRR